MALKDFAKNLKKRLLDATTIDESIGRGINQASYASETFNRKYNPITLMGKGLAQNVQYAVKNPRDYANTATQSAIRLAKAPVKFAQDLGTAAATPYTNKLLRETSDMQQRNADLWTRKGIELNVRGDKKGSEAFFNASKNILSQSAGNANRYTDFASQKKKDVVQHGIDTAKVAGILYNPTSAIKTPVVGGLLSTAISSVTGQNNPKSFAEGVNAGVDYAGIINVTNPIIAGIVGKTIGQLNNPAVKQLTARTLSGFANIGEDYLIDTVAGKDRGAKDNLLSFGIAFIMQSGGTPEDYIKLKKELSTFGLSPREASQFENIISTAKAELTPDPQFKLDYVDENGVKQTLIMNKQLASNWTGYLESQGLEWKLNYLGNQGGFAQAGKTPNPPKTGSIEQLIETNGGWKPGMRQQFDQALFNKDKEALSKLLPEAPSEYKSQFKQNIDEIMGKPTKGVIGIDDLQTTTKTKSPRQSFQVGEVLPHIKGKGSFEVTGKYSKDTYKGIVTFADGTKQEMGISGTNLRNYYSQPTKGVEATQKLKVQAPVQTEIIPKTQAGSSPLLRVQDKQLQIPQQQKITLKNQPLDNQNIELKNPINQPSEDIIADARNMIGESAPKNKKSLRQVADEAYTQWVDRFHPLTKASQKAKADLKTKGAELRPEYDPEYLVRRLTGASSIADHRYQTELKPVIDMVDKAGIEKIDMDAYLANRRMAGFGDIDREVYGADPVKSKAIIQALEQKYPQIKGIADQLYAYQDKGLNEMVEAGFISKEAAQQMRGQNPDYSPLYRVMDDVNDYLGLPTRKAMQGSQPIKKLKGSTKKIESPLESIIGNTFSQRAAIEKNRVASSVVGLQSIYPDMGFSKVAKSGTDTITVWKDGVKEYWQVGADIAEASKGANEEAMNAVLKVLQAPAALLRQGATGRNPDFMIPNIVRDQFDAATTSKYGYLPFVDYFSGLKSMLTNDEVYQKWETSGAKIDLGEMSGRQSIKDSFDEKTTRMGLRDWLSAGLDKMGKYSEQPTRVGLFKKAYEKTGNELLASMESRDSTVDFARMGSKMKVANSIIPFLNVQVQGFDKLIRATKDNPGKVAFNAALFGIVPSITTTLYNLAQMPEEYAEIPQYVKDANFVIVTGRNAEGTVDYISIPKGNVIPVVANPAEHFVNFLFNQERQSFGEFATNFLSSTLPVVGDGSSLKEVGLKTIGQNLPQAIKPAAESLLNKSFWKYDSEDEEAKEIVPSYLKKKEAFEQSYEWTPSTYKAIGAALNVSPLQVQNFLEGHLAGYIKVPNNIIDSLKNLSEGQPVEKNKIPILRRFMGQTYPSSGSKKTEEVKPGTSFMDRITGNVDASSATPAPIPTDQSTFTEVYKQALSKGKGWTEEYNKIMYDPTLTEEEKTEKLAKKKEDMVPWAEMLIRMEDSHPEQVFEAEVEAYATGNGELVEDRGDWVKKQLDKTTDKDKKQELINRLWDEKVLTSGSKGVAQYLLDNYDIDVSKYTGKGKGTGKKAKKLKLSAPPKASAPSAQKLSVRAFKMPKTGLTVKRRTALPTKSPKLNIKGTTNLVEQSMKVKAKPISWNAIKIQNR